MKKSILGLIILSAMTTSCADDYFEPAQESKYMDKIGYKVNLTAGDDFKSRSAGSHDNRIVTIDPIDATIGGKQLYLHTTIDNEFPVVDKSQKAQSRGVEINDGDLDAIKVSAVVYDGEWGADEGFDPKPYMDNELSEAPAWSTNRYWPRESDRIRFYAYAPQNVLAAGPDDIDGLPSGASIPSFEYKVNDEVKNQQDLLVASADYAGNLCTVAHLEFGHALTAVNIQIAKSVADFELTGLVISGLKNQGTYTYNWKDGAMENDKWIEGSNGDSDTISSTHDKGGWTDLAGSASYRLFPRPVGAEQTQVTSLELTGNTDSDVVFTDGNMLLLMMPQELGEDAKITVTGRDKILNKDVTLSANIGGEGQKWVAGKRVTYTLSFNSTRIEYTLDVTPQSSKYEYYGGFGEFNVTSYKIVYSSGTSSDKIKVPWRIEGEVPTWLDNISTSEGVGSIADPENVKYSVLASLNRNTSKSAKIFDDGNVIHAKKGDKNQPFDLSTGELYQGTPSNTANSYIISGPGYYALPLVYGNALVNGNANTQSYNPNTSQGPSVSATTSNGKEATIAVFALSQFVDHNNLGIDSPWIVNTNNRSGDYTPQTAEIVWQDEPCLITNVGLNDKSDYIFFEVNEQTICEGNAVIAVKDASGDIMWSWHIWVTDYYNDYGYLYNVEKDGGFDFSPSSIHHTREIESRRTLSGWDGNATNGNVLDSHFTILSMPIGHCDSDIKEYVNRTQQLKIVQYDNDDLSDVNNLQTKYYTIKQSGGTIESNDNCVFYQYGRPVPMLPTSTGNNANKPFYSQLRTRHTEYKEYDSEANELVIGNSIKMCVKSGAVSIGESIKNPGVFYYQTNRETNTTEANGDVKVYNSWYINGPYYNLWNAKNNILPMFSYTSAMASYEFHEKFNDLLALGVAKTIYDPCPPGFELPRMDAFFGFSNDGTNINPYVLDSYLNLDPRANLAISGSTFEDKEDYALNSTYMLAKAMSAPGVRDDSKYGLQLQFLGHRKFGIVEGYHTFGNVLTANPIALQWRYMSEDEKCFMIQQARLCLISTSKFNSVPDGHGSLRVLSSSDFDLAFPIIPARTGYNPSTIGINAEPGWSSGNDHNYNIDF